MLRRQFPIAVGAALTLRQNTAAALGRWPLGGRLNISLPWPTEHCDPHDNNDPMAAFFSSALFETLYSVDGHGRVYPTLAAELPTQEGQDSIVKLRPGLTTARGKALTERDLEWSLHRARRSGGGTWLRRFSLPRREKAVPLAVRFSNAKAEELTLALTSPLTALLPRSFSPSRPDGCGPFLADLSSSAAALSRNPHAARGPSFLDGVSIHSTSSLADALRAFEVGQSDIGWLGRGLHRPKPGSQMLNTGAVGWIVLHAGQHAGRWGQPGIPSQMLASIEQDRLARFGLRSIAQRTSKLRYSGPECEVVAREESGYLKELGQALAELLSNGPNRVTLRSVSSKQLEELKRSRRFCFLLDLVRSAGPSVQAQQLSLLHEADPNLVRRAPPPAAGGSHVAEHTTRTLSLGIVGELETRIAFTNRFHNLSDFDLGDVWQSTLAK